MCVLLSTLSQQLLCPLSTNMASAFSTVPAQVRLLGAREAQEIDEKLMSSPGFSVDQLMELAGLSVAASVLKVYEPGNVLICVGPGNNGGDGLVAARHLFHFGFSPSIYYPKRTKKDLYVNLVHQAEELGLPFIPELPDPTGIRQQYNLIIDALFGFSFSGAVREPFGDVISRMKDSQVPIVSVDIPSGWHVENGGNAVEGAPVLAPDMLVSLTAPKQGAKFFRGAHHFLGGRFVPPQMIKDYGLTWLPAYPGAEQCVRLEEWGQEGGTGSCSSEKA